MKNFYTSGDGYEDGLLWRAEGGSVAGRLPEVRKSSVYSILHPVSHGVCRIVHVGMGIASPRK